MQAYPGPLRRAIAGEDDPGEDIPSLPLTSRGEERNKNDDPGSRLGPLAGYSAGIPLIPGRKTFVPVYMSSTN